MLRKIDPDYVVLGETLAYNFEQITRAIRLIDSGSHFIAPNPDATSPAEASVIPGCGAMAALMEKATGRSPFLSVNLTHTGCDLPCPF